MAEREKSDDLELLVYREANGLEKSYLIMAGTYVLIAQGFPREGVIPVLAKHIDRGILMLCGGKKECVEKIQRVRFHAKTQKRPAQLHGAVEEILELMQGRPRGIKAEFGVPTIIMGPAPKEGTA